MYVNVETMQPMSLRDIKQLHPNVSIPSGQPDLSSIGYAKLHDGNRPQHTALHFVQETGVEFDGEKWVKTYALIEKPLLSRREAIKAEIEALRDAHLRSFPFQHGGQTYHLQCRDESDKSNWLTVDMTASKLIAAGQGASTITIRTEENAVLNLTAVDVSALMLLLAQHGSAVFARSWELKDAVEASTSPEDIDIQTGW